MILVTIIISLTILLLIGRLAIFIALALPAAVVAVLYNKVPIVVFAQQC